MEALSTRLCAVLLLATSQLVFSMKADAVDAKQQASISTSLYAAGLRPARPAALLLTCIGIRHAIVLLNKRIAISFLAFLD
jgi:hypothetical protein